MMSMLYLMIYLLILYSYLKYTNIKTYFALACFPFVCIFFEFYQRPYLFSEHGYVTILLTFIWLLGLYFYSCKVKGLKDRLYWAMWSVFIFLITVHEASSSIFYVSIGTTTFYLLLQAQEDQKLVKNLMLLSLAADVLYLVLSPDLISTDNHLLAPASAVTYLEIFLKFVVPLSLGVKIFAHHQSLMGAQRNRLLCIFEIFFLTSLYLCKFNSSSFDLSGSDWYVMTLFFLAMSLIILLKTVSDKVVSFQSVFSLAMLNVGVYITLLNGLELKPLLMFILLLTLFLQQYLFKNIKWHVYSPLLSIVFIPTLMLMGIQARDIYFQTSLLLMAFVHLWWVYIEKLKSGRDCAL